MRPGSVGKAYPHFETAINNPDDEGVGEIITRGRNVFMGYLWDEEKTKEVVDDEGWVHSGDLGRVDQDGFFFVNGRMKEVLITGKTIHSQVFLLNKRLQRAERTWRRSPSRTTSSPSWWTL